MKIYFISDSNGNPIDLNTLFVTSMERTKFKERYGNALEMLLTDEDPKSLKQVIEDWSEHYCGELDK